jgi:GAF domain-containing protein
MPNADKKLLILEEGTQLAKLLAEEAGRRGFELVSYRDATGVLVMARQIQADAMLIDGHLRGAGSIVALKGFRRNVNLAALPMIVLSTRSGPKDLDLMAAGANACVPESSAAPAILDTIEKHLQESLDFTPGAPAEIMADPERLSAVAEAEEAVKPGHIGFEKLAQLASELLVSPVSVASFITDTRQIYRGQVGVQEPYASEGGVPLSYTFCQWVVSSNDSLVVEDAREHRVLSQSPVAKELGVVAYCGMPVHGRGNLPVGSMCAIDSKVRNWTPEDLKTLQDLAVVASAYSHWSPPRAREAIVAATRTLRRYAQRLRDSEGRALLDIIDEQALRLAPVGA